MKRLFPVNLRFGLPMLILFFFTVLFVFMTYYQRGVLEQQLEQRSLANVRQDIVRLSRFIEQTSSPDLIHLAEQQLSAIGVNPRIQALAALDERGQVLLATRYAWKGLPGSKVLPQFNAKRFRALQKLQQADIELTDQGRTITGYSPLTLLPLPGEIRPSRVGGLYMLYDLRTARQAVWGDVLTGSILLWLATLLLMSLLILALDYLVSRPLHNLTSASEYLASGGQDVKVDFTAPAELKNLGQTFNRMVDQLRKSHTRLLRQKNLFSVLSKTNQMIVRTDDKPVLFAESCRIAVEFGGFKLAWLGLNEPGTKRVNLVATAGDSKRYLRDIEIALVPKDSYEWEFSVSALHKNQHIIDNEISDTSESVLWSKSSSQNTLSAGAAFSIRQGNQTVGIFAVYTDTAGFFGPDVVALLDDMASNISHALENFEWEAKARQAEELRRNQKNLAVTLNSIGDAVIATDVDGRITRMNPVAEALTDWKFEEAQDHLLTEVLTIVNAQSRKPAENLVEKVLRDRQTFSLSDDTILIAKDGNERYISISTAPIFYHDEKIMGVILVFRDVSEQFALQTRLLKSEERFRHVADNAPVLIWMSGVDKLCTFINKPWLEFSGSSLDQILANGWLEGLHPDDYHHCIDAYNSAFDAREPFKMVYRMRRADGKYRWLLDHGVPRYDSQNRFLGYIGSCLDITESKQTEEEIRLAAIAFETHEAIFVTDKHAKIVRVNNAFTSITGYTADEAIGQRPAILNSGRHDKDFYNNMWKSLNTAGRWQDEIWNKRKNGEIYPQWETITAVKNAQDEITHFVSVFMDISERKEAELQIKQLAFYDPLTDLPNRRLLLDHLQHALAVNRRRNIYGALLFLDLDRFKNVNDALGHPVGDALLKQVAERLKGELRTEDTVARMGGDEFVILLPELSKQQTAAAEQARIVAEKIRVVLTQSFAIKGHELFISPSIGVIVLPDENKTADDLLKQADTAMYYAKAEGRNAIRFYLPSMQDAVDGRLNLEKDLHNALINQEYLFAFQPQVDAAGQTTGAEALLRWKHPQRGMILPGEFIPVAEDTGLILRIGEWALTKACQHISDWSNKGITNTLNHLAVNISPRQFHQENFVELIKLILDKTGADPSFLTLELTESVVIDDVADTIKKMAELKVLGVGFSLDDFGTGYSSLAYLKRLPLDELKIDQSFVRDIRSDVDDEVIVETIISMADHMNLNVIAEGVETEGQYRFLRAKGCRAYQGYYFSHPLTQDEFEKKCVTGEKVL